MSATIIDSLVVMLGLDSKDLENKTPAAVKSLDSIEKTGDKTEKTVGKIGKTSKETAVSVGGLTRAMGSLLAVIGGTVAIKAFVTDFIASSAAVDRLSKNIGVQAGVIAEWSNATERYGGSAQGLQSTLSMLSKAQTQVALTGESALLPYFSAMGISMADAGGHARKVTEYLGDMASFAEGKDRPTMHNLFASMGIDEGTINLLLMGRKELELTLARQKAYADQVQKFAPIASHLQTQLVGLRQKFALMGLSLLQEAAPGLEKLLGYLEKFGDWIMGHQQFVEDFLKVMAVGLAAIAIATAPINLTVLAIVALGAAIALLWDDYQTWKKGGDSFIDWGKWEPEITLATKGIIAFANAMSFAWDKYSEFHDLPFFDKLREKLGVSDGSASLKDLGKVADAADKRLGIGKSKSGVVGSAEIQKYFIGQGWTPAQAAGLAANLLSESGGKANATGDGGSAYGLGQWHADRQRAFKQFSGKDIQNSSAAEQLAFVQFELTQGSEQSAGKALRGATTAQQAGDIVSRRYERPGDVAGEAGRRGAYAASLSGIPGAASVAGNAPGGTPGAPGNTDRSVQVTIGQMDIHTKATDAQGIADDMYHSLDYRLTSQANFGLVP